MLHAEGCSSSPLFLLCLGSPGAFPHRYVCAGQCSQYGMCFSGMATTPNAAPTITLITNAAAPQTTSIKFGYSYQACASGQHPYTGAECEPGATASDSQNGNLTLQVLVCAPVACTTAACIESECILIISCQSLSESIFPAQCESKTAQMDKQLAISLYAIESVALRVLLYW